MTQFAPGPYQFEIPYVTQGLTHNFHINCDVLGTPEIGSSPIEVVMRSKGSTSPSLAVSANALWAVIRIDLAASTIATTYTLWKFAANNQDRVFVSGGSLAAENGGGTGVPVPAWSLIYTYRTGLGNVGKIQLMENNVAGSTRGPMGTNGALNGVALKAYLLSDDCIVLGRDRAFPVQAMNESLSQNEALANKRFRS